MLKRSPIFLRVVVTKEGKIDALDQLEDKPAATEKIFIYRVHGQPGMCHINRGGGKGGFYPMASYRLVEKQPADREVRDTACWRAWTRANAPLRVESMATEHGEPRDK